MNECVEVYGKIICFSLAKLDASEIIVVNIG